MSMASCPGFLKMDKRFILSHSELLMSAHANNIQFSELQAFMLLYVVETLLKLFLTPSMTTWWTFLDFLVATIFVINKVYPLPILVHVCTYMRKYFTQICMHACIVYLTMIYFICSLE